MGKQSENSVVLKSIRRDVTEYLLNYNYLITTCLNTHNAIHYSEACPNVITERTPGDTKLW